MSDDLYNQIAASFSYKSTDELVEIWITNDSTEWSDTAFQAIEAILKERLGTLPIQNQPALEHTEQEAGSTTAETLAEKPTPSGSEPVFYQPSKVLWLVGKLDKLAPVVVLITAVVSIPSLLTLQRTIALYFIKKWWANPIALVLALPVTILQIALQGLLNYAVLKALASTLRILMEMEFNSRGIGTDTQATSADNVTK